MCIRDSIYYVSFRGVTGAKLSNFKEVQDNVKYIKSKTKIPVVVGFGIKEGEIAQKMAKEMLEQGIYVIGFYFPVVPKGKARIRVQISAAMTKHHLDKAINAFTKVGKKLELI